MRADVGVLSPMEDEPDESDESDDEAYDEEPWKTTERIPARRLRYMERLSSLESELEEPSGGGRRGGEGDAAVAVASSVVTMEDEKESAAGAGVTADDEVEYEYEYEYDGLRGADELAGGGSELRGECCRSWVGGEVRATRSGAGGECVAGDDSEARWQQAARQEKKAARRARGRWSENLAWRPKWSENHSGRGEWVKGTVPSRTMSSTRQ